MVGYTPRLLLILMPHRTPKRKDSPAPALEATHPLRTILNTVAQITCLYDMDIPRPDNFNECYLYEGMAPFAPCLIIPC